MDLQASFDSPNIITSALIVSTIGAGILTLILLAKSLIDYSRTGPQLRREIIDHYYRYAVYAVLRLTGWSLGILMILMLTGALSYVAVCQMLGLHYQASIAFTIGSMTTFLLIILQFCHFLVQQPGTIIASWQYRMDRLFPLWQHLNIAYLNLSRLFTTIVLCLLLGMGAIYGVLLRIFSETILCAIVLGLIILFLYPSQREPRPAPRLSPKRNNRPNILMIGSDTLRVDHLGAAGYHRPTSPHIDTLSTRGTLFTHCYVPLARTAPSVATLMTGLLPHRHGIHDNFVARNEAKLPEATLPRLLRQLGYRTATITDWSGADIKKFNFGFDEVDGPDDQWNLKYYLRQGPMPLRLFLSLFCQNPIGQRMLPEIFYQAGTPLTSFLGRRTRRWLTKVSTSEQPFLLNVFMGTTHAPFGSEYPYYLTFADRDYRGESKFVMTTFRDPNEIIEKQEFDQRAFDLDQIIKLYDGSILNFDHEVGKILDHLRECSLSDNTIVVIYSDHGTDFFENKCWGQGNTLIGEDYSARIPLLILDPRRPGQGVIDDIVRGHDLFPTLIELCGGRIPDSLDGQSLVQLLDVPNGLDERVAYQETGIWMSSMPGMDPDHLRYPNLLELLEIPDKNEGTMSIKRSYLPIVAQAKDRMVRQGKWKLVNMPLNHRTCYKLFDMERDPHCLNDVAKQYPEIVTKLTHELSQSYSTSHEQGSCKN